MVRRAWKFPVVLAHIGVGHKGPCIPLRIMEAARVFEKVAATSRYAGCHIDGGSVATSGICGKPLGI